jgi:hypothetical protein
MKLYKEQKEYLDQTPPGEIRRITITINGNTVTYERDRVDTEPEPEPVTLPTSNVWGMWKNTNFFDELADSEEK